MHGEPIVVLMEMTLKNLTEGGVIDHRDFLDRVDLLGSLGKTVLISNYGEYYRLAAYLFRYTKKMIGIGQLFDRARNVWTAEDDALTTRFGLLHDFSQRVLLHQHRGGEHHVGPVKVRRLQPLHVEID